MNPYARCAFFIPCAESFQVSEKAKKEEKKNETKQTKNITNFVRSLYSRYVRVNLRHIKLINKVCYLNPYIADV